MNFKTLVQKVNLHAGLQGDVSSVDASGYQEYLAEAVRSAWVDLQNQREDWKFMWEEVTFNTTPGQSEYLNADIMTSAGNAFGVAKWRKDGLYKDGEKLKELDWDKYQEDKDKYDNDETSKYFVLKEYRNQSLIVPSPIVVHSIRAEYYRTAQVLTSNTDVPLLPEEFHYIIVWKALEDVAAYLGNSGIYERHSFKHDVLENKLMRSQVPHKTIKKKPLYRKSIRQY